MLQLNVTGAKRGDLGLDCCVAALLAMTGRDASAECHRERSVAIWGWIAASLLSSQ
jgi:hypothetical protein